MLDDTVHLEARMGPRKKARAYCMKSDTQIREPQEYGVWVGGPGGRTDLLTLKDLIDRNATQLELFEADFRTMVRYHRGVMQYALLRRPHRDPSTPVIVEWYWGATGSGKSSAAWKGGADAFWLNSTQTGCWWDGYQQEKHVVMDDFRSSWMPFSTLLRILDRYPYRGPNKGTMVSITATRFTVTSHCHPKEMYQKLPMQEIAIKQLLRRITKVIHFVVGVRCMEGSS